MRSAVALLLAGLLGACGGGPESGQAAPAADRGGDAATSAGQGAGAPDSAAAKERLLFNANVTVPGAARLVSYTETGVRFEGPQELQSAIVGYEAELEFTADTYFLDEHKAGDRVQVYGEIEYLNESGEWRLMTMEIHPR